MRCGILLLATSLSVAATAADDPATFTSAVTAGVNHRAAPLSPEKLETLDAVIGEIVIRNGDVFDTDLPEESSTFYRVVNALHIETREEVIRRGLLVRSGDAFSADTIAEAERMLRANDFLQEAEIRPISYFDGQVDLEVATEDTWSLTPSISFSRKGGRNTGGVEIEESNLLGTGSEVKLGFKSEIDRDETFFAFNDGQLGESRFELGLGAADNSDGSAYQFLLQQPFYSLDARRAGGIRLAHY
jgi:outer membrane protein assembly factor BamA